jgi:predicted transcriptional regulator
MHKGDAGMTAKEKIKAIVDTLPDDATYEQIVRELAFGEMVDRGLEDSREGRVISNDEMKKRIKAWRK